MGFCYMLSFMDKTTLSQAALLGIREDLVGNHYHDKRGLNRH
jgi:hypothetical protein